MTNPSPSLFYGFFFSRELLGLLLVFASISGESDADKNIWSSELS
jgi:hypothetical protein